MANDFRGGLGNKKKEKEKKIEVRVVLSWFPLFLAKVNQGHHDLEAEIKKIFTLFSLS